MSDEEYDPLLLTLLLTPTFRDSIMKEMLDGAPIHVGGSMGAPMGAPQPAACWVERAGTAVSGLTHPEHAPAAADRGAGFVRGAGGVELGEPSSSFKRMKRAAPATMPLPEHQLTSGGGLAAAATSPPLSPHDAL